RNGSEHRRPVLFYHLEHRLGRRALREQGGRSSYRKRKQQIRAGGVTEEQLRHRERDVVFCNAQYLFRVALGVVRQVVMKMNRGFRVTRRARGEQPYRDVIATGRGGLERV